MSDYITWVDDFCFDCEVMCKQTDDEHKDHFKLSDKNPPDLGVHVMDGIKAEMKAGK